MANCNFDKDCLQIPIPEDCLPFCAEYYLRRIKPDVKVKVIGLKPETASSIFDAYSSHSITNFSDLAYYLSEEEVREVLNAFRDLTRVQLNGLLEAMR